MKNYPFSFEQLFNFANSDPYQQIKPELKELYLQLESRRKELRFPAVQNDIGQFLQFLVSFTGAENIFEMGSGYGHSAFWFLSGMNQVKNIMLTEKRDDLEAVYNDLPWPEDMKTKMHYHQADAFEVLKDAPMLDIVLIDGVKADYLRFLKELRSKVHAKSLIVIDNSYWRGSFLDPEKRVQNQSAIKIAELHEYLKNSSEWNACFLPFQDGLSLITPVI